MMEIWIRSIARAGGVEVPGSVRIMEPKAGGSRGTARGDVARWLRRAAKRLVRFADRIERTPMTGTARSAS